MAAPAGHEQAKKTGKGDSSPFPGIHEARPCKRSVYGFAAPWIFIWNFEWQLRQ